MLGVVKSFLKYAAGKIRAETAVLYTLQLPPSRHLQHPQDRVDDHLRLVILDKVSGVLNHDQGAIGRQGGVFPLLIHLGLVQLRDQVGRDISPFADRTTVDQHNERQVS